MKIGLETQIILLVVFMFGIAIGAPLFFGWYSSSCIKAGGQLFIAYRYLGCTVNFMPNWVNSVGQVILPIIPIIGIIVILYQRGYLPSDRTNN